jgi:hypothetical protein
MDEDEVGRLLAGAMVLLAFLVGLWVGSPEGMASLRAQLTVSQPEPHAATTLSAIPTQDAIWDEQNLEYRSLWPSVPDETLNTDP